MAKWHHRVAASIGALLFLVTSVALTVTVLWSMHQQSKKDAINQGLQQALQQANAQKQVQQQTPQEGKLQGTKLSNFTPVSSVDTLQTVDLTPGTGDAVKAGDTVTAHYTGALAKDGTIFESSLDSGQPATFPLSGVIAGWQQGVPGMKVGGTRRLIIPASLAYGAKGSPPKIGPNEPLVFDITLVKIGK